jgi:DNA helicase II / ATP-dependent DNA helicase PcrA
MDDNQALAVAATEGPVLIIAGPGSGKTRTLVNRTVHLILERDIPPSRILISTFTRKAAAELETRIAEAMRDEAAAAGRPVNINDLHVGTMHSLFIGILQKYREQAGLGREIRMLEDFEQQYLVYRHLEELLAIPFADGLWMTESRGRTPSDADKSKRILAALNRVSDESLDVDQLLRSGQAVPEALARVYLRYQELLQEEKAIDFALIQTKLLTLLRSHPDVLRGLQETYRYIMIDEYQDTNTIQEQILLLLAGESGNLCVVGDDDQSIYRFRGARVQNLSEFPTRFPQGTCKVIRLERNYRSHPRIVKFFAAWMAECRWQDGLHSYRLDKELQAVKPDAGQATRVIQLAGRQGSPSWHREVHDFLRTIKDQHIISDWNQVVFLFRSVKNRDVQDLARYLESRDIPVFAPRSGLFFERKEVRLFFGAMTALFYPHVPNGSIPVYFTEALQLLGEEVKAIGDREFEAWIERERNRWTVGYPYASLMDIFYMAAYFRVFRPYLTKAYMELEQRSLVVRNMASLSQWLARFERLHGFAEHEVAEGASRFFAFFSYLLEQGLDEYEDDTNAAPSGFVSFMTIHQAKGLEFPVVVTGSLESSPYPYPDALEADLRPHYPRAVIEPLARENEFDFYRLFYTAFTRAQELLVLTCAESPGDQSGRWRSPSLAFSNLYDRLADWRDDRVKLSSLQLQPTKRITLGRKYAYTSHIRLYEECPRKYLYQRVYQFESAGVANNQSLMLGNLIHYTIEDMHRALIGGRGLTEADLPGMLHKNLAELAEGGGMTSEDARVLLEEAGRHVWGYYGRMHTWPSRIQQAEASVSSAVGDYFLVGKLDAVFETAAGSLEILDLKTGKRRDTDEELEAYRRQLQLYAYLLEQSAGREVTGTALYFTTDEEQPLIHVPAAAEERGRVIEEMLRTVDAIEARQFADGPLDPGACRRCEWQYYCNREPGQG